MLSCCWHCCHDMLWPALAVDMKMHPHLVLINWHSWAQSLSHCSHVIMMCPVGGDHKTTYGFCSEWSHMVTWIRCTDQISISVCVCVGVLSVYFCTALKTFHTLEGWKKKISLRTWSMKVALVTHLPLQLLQSWLFTYLSVFLLQCLRMSKRSLFVRLVPCRCLRGEEEAVTSLDYSHCSLETVPKEIFSFEKTLQELYLDANQIEELPKVRRRILTQLHEGH